MRTDVKMARQPTSLTRAEQGSREWDRALDRVEQSAELALQTYSNVHRGTGQFSVISTVLYEQARNVALDCLGLRKENFTIVFTSPYGAERLSAWLPVRPVHVISSGEAGLPLGIRALVLKRRHHHSGVPPVTGGGVVKLVGAHSVVWDDCPSRFEAGTPNLIGVVAFVCALRTLGRRAPGCSSMPSLTMESVLHADEASFVRGRALLDSLRQTALGRGMAIPTTHGLRPYANLDNAASTPALGPVWDVVRRAWRQPSGGDGIAQEVKHIVADYVGASLDQYDVIFTANATEALNILARGLELAWGSTSRPVVVNTDMEHHSNDLPWRYISGATLVRLPVDDEGFADIAALDDLLRGALQAGWQPKLVTISGASNVLGSLNDLASIARTAHAHGALVGVDAAQLVAHRPVDMSATGIDFLAFSAHKVYAPFGSGALVFRRGTLGFAPDELQAIRQMGSENVAGLAAMGQAFLLLKQVGLDVVTAEEMELTGHLIDGLRAIPEITVFGVTDRRSSRFAHRTGVVSFSVRTVPHNLAALMLAELGGVGVRHGCFCAHLIAKRLMGIARWRERLAELGFGLFPRFTEEVAPGIVRASLGIENSMADVDRLVATMREIVAEPLSWDQRLLATTYNGDPHPPATDVGREIAGVARAISTQVYGPV
ncbi:MAG: aminotransferase class V-fold PLP-dependent enzyme [Chloroflexi bacterium]|nr:aminotransferase class V-fold PLP-dependent enzyme [Chloroflexota bacterium]